jgi:hypothetical protein
VDVSSSEESDPEIVSEQNLNEQVPTPASVKPAKPVAPAQSSAPAPAAAPAASVPATTLAEAKKFSRVTEDGHVFLLADGAEVAVGQFPDKSADEALAFYARKYDEIVAQVALLEQRIATGGDKSAEAMTKTLDSLDEQVKERKYVGDVAALEARIEDLRVALENLRATQRVFAEKQRQESLEIRERIVAEAEAIAETDPQRMQWKHSSARMAELFDAWKNEQRSGHRVGRATEDALWKRFRTARGTFDKHRKAFFSKLDTDNAEAKRQKEALIKRAEELQNSTDWGNTAREYRRLMDEWKASKRASRRDDDALWARFRAAQDVFFAARKADNDRIDAAFGENLKVKEALLEEARALLPVKNLASAQKALNSIRDRWEDAGKVPRGDMNRIESGLRQVEDAVKAAEDDAWRRSNPETKARSNSMLAQLEEAIAGLEKDLADAQATGNSSKIAKAQEALDARRAWLETVQRSASDLN